MVLAPAKRPNAKVSVFFQAIGCLPRLEPAPCAETRVIDEDMRECPPGTQGELWLGGSMVIQGFWRTPKASARDFAGGF